jgi:hypothetical protein
VLLILFAIFVFAVVAYVYWDKASEHPPGLSRWLWIAFALAGGGALALRGDDTAPRWGKVAVAALAVVLGVLFKLARQRALARAGDRPPGPPA